MVRRIKSKNWTWNLYDQRAPVGGLLSLEGVYSPPMADRAIIPPEVALGERSSLEGLYCCGVTEGCACGKVLAVHKPWGNCQTCSWYNAISWLKAQVISNTCHDLTEYVSQPYLIFFLPLLKCCLICLISITFQMKNEKLVKTK